MSQRRREEADTRAYGHRKRIGAREDWYARITDWSLRWVRRYRRSAIMKEGKVRRVKPPWRRYEQPAKPSTR